MPARRSNSKSRSSVGEGGSSSRRRDGRTSSARNSDVDDEGGEEVPPPAGAAVPPPPAPREDGGVGNSVAAHVRDRQRAVAEREASRLARPDRRPTKAIAHADKKRSAVTSTPFGILPKSSRTGGGNDDDDDDDGVEEWCGPFSVARQMIAKREAAKRKREAELEEQEQHHPLDALMDQVNMEQKRRAHPSMQWKSNLPSTLSATAGGGAPSSTSSMYAKRQKRVMLSKGGDIGTRIPSLFQLCVDFVVQNFEYVESLGDVDNDVRLAISRELVGRNQLDGKALEALVHGSLQTMETLEVVDCAGIPQDTMAATLAEMSGLRYLLLTHAGRAFGTKSVTALVEKNKTAQLCCLDIAGAYLLKDEDSANLIKTHSPTLQSLAFSTCPLLGEQFVNAIVHTTDESSKGTTGLLELSLKDMALAPEHLQKLTSSPQSKVALRTLRALTLRSMTGLTDDLLANLLRTVGDSLDSLDVSYNYELTDTALSSIRLHNPHLKTLVLNGVKELTAAGLEALFTHPLPGLPPPPKLKVLELASVDHEAVTDELLRLVTAAASSDSTVATDVSSSSVMDDDNDNDARSKAMGSRLRSRTGGRGLVRLDIQGSTVVTDTFLEELVETSSNSLQEINVSYCPLITDQGLGYLVSKVGKQLIKIQVWGCAQLTDDFFDGHDRVQDPTFEIVGAWMKKSGARSLR
jgi:hypothetical protein